MLQFDNQLEPSSLVQQFTLHPPDGFGPLHTAGHGHEVPAFVARFNLLTSADAELKQRVRALPLYKRWAKLLSPQAAFVGTTVSEYALLPRQAPARDLPLLWRKSWGHKHALLIVKDIPSVSPLLSARENARADELAAACVEQGFLLLEGQALAYVPIDFPDVAGYLASLTAGRRKNLRRKLRSLDALDVDRVNTGSSVFDDERVIDAYYALYVAVHAQSEVQFDRLTRSFVAAVLRDPDSAGVVFTYRLRVDPDASLIGWNLCYVVGGKLIDKYIGLAYPVARDHNLYFVSWVLNLEFAVERGLSHYVAGWTDPQVKAQLGARFTFTRHAVYIRNPLLRAIGRLMARRFEGDRTLLEASS